MHTTPAVSIIVPVHNGGSRFARCLESLEKTKGHAHEIIVVADGDTDNSWRLAERSGCRIIRFPEPGGPARARNAGAAEATGEILFFVDADVTVPPDAVHRIAGFFHREPEVSAVIGSYDDAPAENHFLSQYRNLLHHFTHQTSNREASTFWGACGAIKRSVFQKMGGFNESYSRPCIEDIEFGYRLKKEGFRINLFKEFQVKHLKRWDALSMLKTDLRDRAIPWTLLIHDTKGFINDLNITRSSRASVMAAYSLLVSMAGAILFPRLLYVSAFSAIVLLVLNRGLYSFFREKRGLLFAVKAIPWHWLYYLYSGLGFVVGSLIWKFNRLRRHERGQSRMRFNLDQ